MKKDIIATWLLSFGLLSLELSWTRIFSAEFYYTFAFLILSLAILGLGLGSLCVKLFNLHNKNNILDIFLILSGVFTLIGPPIIFRLGYDFTTTFNFWEISGKLLITILLLSSAYIFSGIALGIIFKKNHENISKFYMADLIGAGIGVVGIIFLMNIIGTPASVILCALPLFIAAIIYTKKSKRGLPIFLIIITILSSFFSEQIINSDRKEKAVVLSKHWDSMSKIKVVKYNDNYRGILIDNTAGSTVIGFDGNYNRPDSLKYDFGINISYLIKYFYNCRFVSLGAGGGKDVLQALFDGAKEVHAVEVNPYINYIMQKGELSEFSGNIYNDKKVKVVTEDARIYLKRFTNKFDIICSFSTNSYAALASGAFAMSENYIFTTEAIKDYWNALSDNGFLIMEHHFYIPRLIGSVVDALNEMKISNHNSHIAVYRIHEFNRDILLLSKKPLTDSIRLNAFGKLNNMNNHNIYLLYPCEEKNKNNIVNLILTKGWKNVAQSVRFDISPCTDDKPYINQMGMWKNFSIDMLKIIEPYEYYGFPLSKIILIIILIILTAIIIPLNIIPFFIKKDKNLSFSSWLYFFSIGLGFMMIEVILIQKYTLFLGPSIYSIITILGTLLIASGIGSNYSRKINKIIPFIVIILWVVFDVLFANNIFNYFIEYELFFRIIISIVLLFPLGFFMGMPFPLGVNKVGELVDWAFAINGAASVFGATIVVLFTFTFGFNISLFIAITFYFIALVLIRFRK